MVREEEFMLKAIEIAKKGYGFASPGPLEGAVLVNNNVVIGFGYRKRFRERPVWEFVEDITSINIKTCELYMNIEPDIDNIEIIKQYGGVGIKKIYFGILNPVSPGRVTAALCEEGIEVCYDVLKEQCEELNEVYLHYIKKGTPFVFVKWAMTLDGKLATRTGDSKWISGKESLRFVHQLRQQVMAIMVGENTVRLDNPMLTTRLEGVEISNPIRIILSKYGDIPKEANVLKVDENTKTIILTSNMLSRDKEVNFKTLGIDIIKFEEKNGKIDFRDIIHALGDRGIDSLYIEGGSGVLGSAFESGIVNKVYAAIAPKIIGGKDALTPVGGVGVERMRDAIILNRVAHEIVGSDVIIKGYVD